MNILHAHGEPRSSRSICAESQPRPTEHPTAWTSPWATSTSPALPKRPTCWATHPGKVRILIGRAGTPTRQEIVASYNPRESANGCHAGQNRRDGTASRDETRGNVGRNTAAQTQDNAHEAGIKSLASLIADGKVDVRAYVKERMHAKGYTGLAPPSSAQPTSPPPATPSSTTPLPRRRHRRNPEMVRAALARKRAGGRQSGRATQQQLASGHA